MTGNFGNPCVNWTSAVRSGRGGSASAGKRRIRRPRRKSAAAHRRKLAASAEIGMASTAGRKILNICVIVGRRNLPYNKDESALISQSRRNPHGDEPGRKNPPAAQAEEYFPGGARSGDGRELPGGEQVGNGSIT